MKKEKKVAEEIRPPQKFCEVCGNPATSKAYISGEEVPLCTSCNEIGFSSARQKMIGEEMKRCFGYS